jgi:hypothetical protein
LNEGDDHLADLASATGSPVPGRTISTITLSLTTMLRAPAFHSNHAEFGGRVALFDGDAAAGEMFARETAARRRKHEPLACLFLHLVPISNTFLYYPS